MSPHQSSIETRASWIIASVALVILTIAFGSAWVTSVALKEIAEEAGGSRAIPSLAMSLVWLGNGVGGIIMGRLSFHIGVRWTVMIGGSMVALGLVISTLGLPWPFWVGHGVFMGVIGIGGMNAPMYIYVSQLFDKRRGSALALISSGAYLSGAIWPPVFERAVAYVGWKQTMLIYAGVVVSVALPLTIAFLRPLPPQHSAGASSNSPARALKLHPNLFFALLCAGAVLCCIPMAMPQQHLVAFCNDVGLSLSTGAAMLSVLLGAAFLSRQIWGLISDRIGGLMTIFIGSGAQATAMCGFLLTQSEAGLFFVAAMFGLGFSAIIPAYALAVRELFPVAEAYWRIPTVLMCTSFGMAIGGWLAGYLYDLFGYYAPAFAAGIGFNILNFTVIGFLAWKRQQALAAS